MDLTPRATDGGGAEPDLTRGASRRRWAPVAVIVVALVAGGAVVTKFLTSAIDYYCNVDEVGTRRGCEGDRRIRVQGIVRRGSLDRRDAATVFEMEWNGRSVRVEYLGDPGGVFQECIPVVAHGRMDGATFESDRIEVKHSNQYVEKNPTRLDESRTEAAACSVQEG